MSGSGGEQGINKLIESRIEYLSRYNGQDVKIDDGDYKNIKDGNESLKNMLLEKLNEDGEVFEYRENRIGTPFLSSSKGKGMQHVQDGGFWWFQFAMKKYSYKCSPISISIYINSEGVKVDIVNDDKTSNKYSRMLINRIKENNASSNTKSNVGEKTKHAKIIEAQKDKNYAEEIKNAIWGNEKEKGKEEGLMVYYKEIMEEESVLLDKIGKAFETKKQVVLTGAPGTGKTWSARKYAEDIVKGIPSDGVSRIKFVQFHPSFDYTDFVEGLKPVRLAKDDTSEYSFVRVDGIFKKFCREIVEWNGKHDKEGKYPFFFIIDEINRADLSKVFGELMYCLDEDYRDKKPYPQSQYSYLPTYKINKAGFGEPLTDDDVFKDGFYIPKNLYIIGTMNDIDRSVETFDFALRRRFKWIDVKAADVMQDALCEMQKDRPSGKQLKYAQIEKAAEHIDAMNKVISGDQGARLGFSDAFHIGPSYFKTLEYDSQKSKDQKIIFKWDAVFNEFVEPILREYTRPYSEEQKRNFIGECFKALKGKDEVSDTTNNDANGESESSSDPNER